jgi:hypothetical protein
MERYGLRQGQTDKKKADTESNGYAVPESTEKGQNHGDAFCDKKCQEWDKFHRIPAGRMAHQAEAKHMEDNEQDRHGAELRIDPHKAHRQKEKEGREDSSKKMVGHCRNIGYGGNQWHKRRVDHLSAYHPESRLKPKISNISKSEKNKHLK